jgi:hypothetical protein
MLRSRRGTSPPVGAVDAVPVDHQPGQVRKWLSWTAVGMEGIVFKRLDNAYHPSARGWHTYKATTTETIVGAITGSPISLPPGLQGGCRRRERPEGRPRMLMDSDDIGRWLQRSPDAGEPARRCSKPRVQAVTNSGAMPAAAATAWRVTCWASR